MKSRLLSGQLICRETGHHVPTGDPNVVFKRSLPGPTLLEMSDNPTPQELVDKSFQMKKSSLDKFLALATRRRRSRGLSGLDPTLCCARTISHVYCVLSAGDAVRETTLKTGTRRTAAFDAKKTEEAALNSIERWMTCSGRTRKTLSAPRS
jgi:hypothetical protein